MSFLVVPNMVLIGGNEVLPRGRKHILFVAVATDVKPQTTSATLDRDVAVLCEHNEVSMGWA